MLSRQSFVGVFWVSRVLGSTMAPPDTVLDAGHLPLEIMQKIAGRMDFRDWGRAAASACRMFHTLQPGTLYQCCVHYLQTPEGFRPALIVHAVLVA